jgi:prepilin-type N-terminal cleavage/methylation domain-containing protein
MIAQAMKSSSTKAFTLVELIVVITILAILATVGFLSLQGYTKDARNASTKSNIGSVVSAISNESALSALSPISYVTAVTANMSGGTLSGVVVYSGQLATNAAGTYAAGTLKFDVLRLDAAKFKDNNNNFLAGAVSVSETTNGKVRARSAFQVAGTIDEGAGGRAYVQGNYAVTGLASDAAGLIYSGAVNGATPGSAIVNGLSVLPYAY